MIISFGFAFIANNNKSIFQRVLFTSIMIGIAVSIFPLVLKFSKIEQATLDNFNNFAVTKASLLNKSYTSSAIDISSYPFPLKVFTFLRKIQTLLIIYTSNYDFI
jgi:hypothetical protein